jgi:hypothetical protein
LGKKEIQLDSDAENLFQELKGIETGRKLEKYSDIEDLMSGSLNAEEERLDHWRAYLLETVFLVSHYFVDVRFLEGIQSQKDTFSELINTLTKLDQMPDRGKTLLIQYRGRPTGTKISPKTDYVVSCGKLILDSANTQAMLNRMGLSMAHLTGRLSSTFEVFSKQGINTLFIRLPENSPTLMQQLKECLEIIARFNHAVSSNKPIVYLISGKQKAIVVIPDERGVPDANLTLVSALNNLKPEFMQKLVAKVNDMVDSGGSRFNERFTGIYDAIFSIAGIRKKLIQPPLELNNIKWLIKSQEQQKISVETVKVARHVMDKVEGSPEKKIQVLKSVYGNDYQTIDSGVFGERIQHVSDLLNSLEKNFADNSVHIEVVDNLRQRFEEVQDNIYDNLFVSDHYVRIHDYDRDTILEKVNDKLKDMLSFFKGRAKIRKKLTSGKFYALELTDEDYQNIAQDFNVPIEDARSIISLLKSCFNSEGGFKRSVFEENIPKFAEYEDKVFDLLWHYLKETPTRNDRVAFLNSLQLLMVRMQRPEIALKVLLEEVCKDPEVINYSDRNSFILANLLVRKYNQELRVDIENTPEEVLEVREGINQQMAQFAREILISKQEAFFTKIKTIHHKILDRIGVPESPDESMSLRFLLSFEREVFIFLSLIQGSTARSVLRSALKEYGTPESFVYINQKGENQIRTILNHFRIIVRAAGRLEDKEALLLLTEISKRENFFLSLGKGRHYDELVKRLFQQIRNALLLAWDKIDD